MGAALSQVNARLDADLKEAGDRALAAAGYTATRAIRALWKRAAELIDDPKAIQELLEPDEVADQEAASAKMVRPPLGEEWVRKLQLAEEGAHIYENALLELGIDIHDPSFEPDTRSYEELRDEILQERLQERGLDK